MKPRFWIVAMLRLSRFLLYCVAAFAGVAGLLAGGIPLLKYAAERLAGNNYEAYLALSSYDRFSEEVIFMLSLMLLILVHLGHVLAGGLRFTKPEKPVLLQNRFAGSLRPPQKEMSDPLPKSGQTQEAAGLDEANEKLAPLVRKAKDNHAAQIHRDDLKD
jgi:hypothetical protein